MQRDHNPRKISRQKRLPKGSTEDPYAPGPRDQDNQLYISWERRVIVKTSPTRTFTLT